MHSSELTKNYFQLFDLPVQFKLDEAALGGHFRKLQQQFHPDRYAAASESEQRLAVQYSALVNQAYAILRQPLPRALYLLELKGMSQEQVSAQKVAGGFLMEQLDLREKLETISDMVDPESVLEHLMSEIALDISVHRDEFSQAYAAENFEGAAVACVKMQYLVKLMTEAEQIESDWLD